VNIRRFNETGLGTPGGDRSPEKQRHQAEMFLASVSARRRRNRGGPLTWMMLSARTGVPRTHPVGPEHPPGARRCRRVDRGLAPTGVDHILDIGIIVITRSFPSEPEDRAPTFTALSSDRFHHDVPDGANRLSRYAQRAASAPVDDGMVVRGGNNACAL
jgi:hypothetical protein